MTSVPRRDYSSLPRGARKRLEVIELAEHAKSAFEGYESEEGLIIDARDRLFCRYWVENQSSNRRSVSSRYPYASKLNKIILKGLIILGENNCFKDPVDRDEFKEMIVKDEPDMYRSEVNTWLKGNVAKKLFEINGKIKPRYPVKGVLTQ